MTKTTAKTTPNVVDLGSYRRRQSAAAKPAVTEQTRRACRHCGAWLADDESDDDCSSVFRAFETAGPRV
ncbi:MAG TPA: hypothetical protein VNZ94_09070 [Xanthobacteraceae bacterium]|nr:hypothetical protein [Xanthobacteraceae bacterium]